MRCAVVAGLCLLAAQLRWWPRATGALLAYLEDAYGDAFETPTADAPVWLSYARNNLRGDPLGTQGIAKMCEKRLGVSKSHVLRHTFAHNMETAGAKVSEIQARLGDASIAATTGKYLVALRADENPYGDTLASISVSSRQHPPSRLWRVLRRC